MRNIKRLIVNNKHDVLHQEATENLNQITMVFQITMRSSLVRHQKALCRYWHEHFKLYDQIILICFTQLFFTSYSPQRIHSVILPLWLHTIHATFSHLHLNFLSLSFLYDSNGPSGYLAYYFPT